VNEGLSYKANDILYNGKVGLGWVAGCLLAFPLKEKWGLLIVKIFKYT
jgi:hypothetical protein